MTKKAKQTGAQTAQPGGTGASASAAASGDQLRNLLSSTAYQAQMFSGGDTVELKLYGEIGEGLFSQGATAKQVSDTLSQAPAAKLIRVRMSSPGGSVWEGMAIRSILAAHPAHVDVDVEGLCASAATIIAMAGDTVRMHAGSSMMVHEGHRRTIGDLREHQRACATLEAINDGAATVIATRTGKTKEEIKDLMEAETWFTPEAAKEMGLCDEIVAGKAPPTAAKGTPGHALMSLDLSAYGYRNVPPHYAAVSMQLAEEPPLESSTSSTRETNTMSYARIAMALGLSGDGAEEAAVMAAVGNLNRKLQRGEALMTELRTLTGKQSDDELLGAVRGLTEVGAQLPKLQAQIAQQEEKLQASERAQLVAADAADPKGRRLTPALVQLFANKPAAELKAYLEVAPHVVQTTPDNAQPAAGSQNGGAATSQMVVSPDGKTWEQMSAVEKHNLHHDHPEIYKAVRADFERRKRGV